MSYSPGRVAREMLIVRAKKLLLTAIQRGSMAVVREKKLLIRFGSLFLRRGLSSSCALDAETRSSTISYLVDSCGLSVEDAVAASKNVRIVNTHEPDSFLALLRNYGLQEAQISKIVRYRPKLLLGNPERVFRPKMEFLLSIAASKTELGKIVYQNPGILAYSLENRLIPYYNFFKHEFLLKDEDIVRTLKSSPWVLQKDAQKKIARNVSKLRELGVSDSSISRILGYRTTSILLNSENFDRAVKKVISMGFKPATSTFIHAMSCLGGLRESTRELKHGVYRRWGWSDEDIVSAFRRCPNCMNLSEENISNTMDFLVNKMHYESSMVARYPLILAYSLKKRIVPRCCVFKVLKAEGCIEGSVSLLHLMTLKEMDFLDRFVKKYMDKFPDLLPLYQGKISPEKLVR